MGRLLGNDDLAQSLGVQHIDNVGTVSDLHCRRVGVPVHGNDFDSVALEFDGDFLPEFTGSAEEGSPRHRRQWCSDLL